MVQSSGQLKSPGSVPESPSPGNSLKTHLATGQPKECVHGHGELIRKLNRFNYCTSNGQWKNAGAEVGAESEAGAGGSDRRTGGEGALCSSADGTLLQLLLRGRRLLVFYEK